MTVNSTRAKSTPRAVAATQIAALLATLMASACTSSPTPPHQTTTTPAPKQTLSPSLETASESWTLSHGLLVIHVGKTGRLARLGHNHLVSSSQLAGYARVSAQDELLAKVTLRVADINVDDPALRASYRQRNNGNSPWASTYASTPSEKNIADTRSNMLGKRVLDAADHPYIEVLVRITNAGERFTTAESGSLLADLSVSIKSANVVIPAELTWQRLSTSEIAWQSSFDTTHKALGLTPFSALGGALAVAEPLQFEVIGVLEHSGTVQITGPSVGRR